MITIISGTNRPNSYTQMLAEYYQSELRKLGVEANMLSLIDLPQETLSPNSYRHKPETFKPIQDLILNTEKFIFIIPEYNGSFPGVLKVLIDSCQYPDSFYHKKACLVGLSAGKYGNIRGVEHFNGICGYLNMHVLPLRLHIPLVKSEFDADKRLLYGDTKKFIDEQILKFITF